MNSIQRLDNVNSEYTKCNKNIKTQYQIKKDLDDEIVSSIKDFILNEKLLESGQWWESDIIYPRVCNEEIKLELSCSYKYLNKFREIIEKFKFEDNHLRTIEFENFSVSIPIPAKHDIVSSYVIVEIPEKFLTQITKIIDFLGIKKVDLKQLHCDINEMKRKIERIENIISNFKSETLQLKN